MLDCYTTRRQTNHHEPRTVHNQGNSVIRKELEHLAVSIDELQTHPSNVRQGDIGAICESLKAHGQYRTIVYQHSTKRILAGNHTYKAAKALGWTHIAATPVICDDQQALRILLADNKANDLATYDEAELIELLKQLADTDEGLLGTLFDGQELDDLISDDQQDQSGDQLLFAEKYEVVIECKDENEQGELLERLYNEGLKVRALTI
jgi:ParB-like chromosome segregation protein Spo0J